MNMNRTLKTEKLVLFVYKGLKIAVVVVY